MSADQILTEDDWARIGQRFCLSSRQVQVLRHVVDGYGDKQIASMLGITGSAIRAHLKVLSKKLHAKGRTQLLLKVLHESLGPCRDHQCSRC